MNSQDRDLKCLPLYGDPSAARRLFDRPRLEVEVRRAYVRRVMGEGAAELDPILQAHLGLGRKQETEPEGSASVVTAHAL
jgi:hypothetical protein